MQADDKRPRSGRLVPLGAYIEELFHACGRPFPPSAHAKRHRSSDRLPEDGQGGYIHLERSVGSQSEQLFCAPFFAIPLPDGAACVSDYGGNRLCIVSKSGAIVTIGKDGDVIGDLIHPQGLALGADGSLFVVDGSGRIQVLDDEGNAVRSFSGTTQPYGDAALLHRFDDDVWLPHPRHSSSVEQPASCLAPGDLSTPNPATLPPLTPPPSAARPGAVAYVSQAATQPYALALGHDGRVYVSDNHLHRVVCYRPDGEFAFDFGSCGSAPGELRDPRGLAVHSRQVWVADMCNHRVSIFSLRGRPIRHIGRFGDGPSEFQHPVGVAHAMDLLLVSEYTGARIQILTPSGGCLQIIQEPFEGAYLGALGADARRVSVTDSQSRLHCFYLHRRGEEAAVAPPFAPDEEDGGPLVLAPARDKVREEATRTEQQRRTRAGRIALALAATDYRDVLSSLTRDDVAALVPAAHEHATHHPELYSLPPVRSADDLMDDLEQYLNGTAPPLGPPH